jgi:hypothetical protein
MHLFYFGLTVIIAPTVLLTVQITGWVLLASGRVIGGLFLRIQRDSDYCADRLAHGAGWDHWLSSLKFLAIGLQEGGLALVYLLKPLVGRISNFKQLRPVIPTCPLAAYGLQTDSRTSA